MLSQGQLIPEEEPTAKRLLKREVLCREGGRLVFCVPVMGEWVRENY